MENTAAFNPVETVRVGIAAKALGVTPQTVRNMIKNGQLRSFRLPIGEWRIPVSELDRILEPLGR